MNLGWTKVVEELGRPIGPQQPVLHLQAQAEASGCLVKSLIISKNPFQSGVEASVATARLIENQKSSVQLQIK